jgi:hypothetical protein
MVLVLAAVCFVPDTARAADAAHLVTVNIRPIPPVNSVTGLRATFHTPATPPVFYSGKSSFGNFVFGGIAVGGTAGLDGSEWLQMGWYSESSNPQPRLLVQAIGPHLNYAHFFGPLAADTDYTFRLSDVGGSDWAAYLETAPEQLLVKVPMPFVGAPWASARVEVYGSTGGDETIPDLRVSGIDVDVNWTSQPLACGRVDTYRCPVQMDAPYTAEEVQPGWSGFTARDSRTKPVGPNAFGYWLVGADGGVFSFGDATFHGSTGSIRLSQPVVGVAPTPSRQGYWLIASDGGVFSFGDATFHGSTGGIRLSQPVVGLAPTPSGQGYWLVASDGGVFSFGDATFHGSAVGAWPGASAVGISATPTGKGYWLVSSNGSVAAFGDANSFGPLASARPQRPVIGIASTTSGIGYWLASSDGGVLAFGDALPYPSTASFAHVGQVVAITPSTNGGYWLADSAGTTWAFGNAPALGSAAGLRLAARIVGMAAR